MHQTILQILKQLCFSIVNTITIMSTGRSPHLLFMLIVLFSLLSAKAISGSNSRMEDERIINCIKRERHALLMIKQSLVDDGGLLSSWGPEDDKKDCCKWQGVSCSNRTGHVVKLVLQGSDDFVDGSSWKWNHLRGNLSSSMLELQQLHYLDLSYHDFGRQPIPKFIGSLNKLRHLDLSFSNFGGRVPYQLGNLSRLQFLDISNPISLGTGTIPKCLNNLTAMVQKWSFQFTTDISYTTYHSIGDGINYAGMYENTETIMWKGIDREYKENLGYLKCIDLSSNKLFGEVPVEITSLEGLRSLNLSKNSLTGSITTKIGNLTLLDSLDLSNNKLIGEIPSSFSSLTFLGMLNLSNNNLSGKIPVNTILQTFDAPTYMGNPNLCGLPLPKCLETEVPIVITQDNSDDDVIVTLEFYVCLAIGFIVGFWGVLGSLFLNKSWRHAYFHFLNRAKDRLYIAMVLNIAKLQRGPMTRS